jgi:hypothetical protein
MSFANHQPTHGEKLVYNLLKALPKKEFFFRYEPQIVNGSSAAKPDFVVVSALLGVLIIEVKDWVELAGGKQDYTTIRGRDGILTNQTNPLRQAEGYAYDLKERFKSRAELWEERKGRQALKFPWQVMVALPYITQGRITQFEAAGIWQRGVVAGRERLANASTFETAIRALPWLFKPERPLSLDMLDIIREIIDPSLSVEDRDGRSIGTLTRAQEALIGEPIKILQPKQTSFFPEESLSIEAEGVAENAEARLVRGVAGSGKTLVLMRRARRLLHDYPNGRFLVLTFNRELARDLEERIAALTSHNALTPSPSPSGRGEASNELTDEEETAPVQRFSNLDILNLHRIFRAVLAPIWHDPIKPQSWLKVHAAAEIQQLEKPLSFIEDEFAWRIEHNILTDNAYFAADRSGRSYPLGQSQRGLINTMFNRYRMWKDDQQLIHQPWFDWDDVPFLAEQTLLDNPHLAYRAAYDAILIDEGQDFTPSWMRVVRLLLKPNGSLFICDDPAQSIFHSYSWAQKGVAVSGRTVHLKVPFRSTREISQAAHALVNADDLLRGAAEKSELDLMSYELSSGQLPALIACASEDDERRFVNERIAALIAEGVPPVQIAVLCPRKNQLGAWSLLEKLGVYRQFYEKMKGLEFVAVFLPQLETCFDDGADAEQIAAMRRKIFTAMTRARRRLFMTYHGRLPTPLNPLLEVTFCESYVG